MDLATRQAAKAVERDDAVQRLRDMTVAVAIASLGAVGLLAWISAATFPGTGSSQPSGQAPSTSSAAASNASGDDLQPTSAVTPAGSGSGLAVSGASH